MALKGYRPSILSLQEDFARRIAHQKMQERRNQRRGGPLKKPEIDMDNSEPWMTNPSSIGDFISISDQIDNHLDEWRPRFRISSTA